MRLSVAQGYPGSGRTLFPASISVPDETIQRIHYAGQGRATHTWDVPHAAISRGSFASVAVALTEDCYMRAPNVAQGVPLLGGETARLRLVLCQPPNAARS